MTEQLLDELVNHLGIPGRRRWLTYAIHVGQAAPYVYVEVPKAACTTVKNVLRQVEQHEPLENPMDIHNRERNGLPGLSASAADSLAELVETHTWFTVVRHPIERLLSGFKSKILRSYKPDAQGNMEFRGVEMYADEVNAMLERKYFRLGAIPSFDQFVRHVCLDQKDYERNIHWRHLHKCTWPQLIDYDHIVQAEDLATEFGPIVQEFAPGFHDEQGLLSTRENSTSNLDAEHDFMLSDSTLDIFAEAYEKDLRLFGYELESYRNNPNTFPAPTPRAETS